MACGAARQRRYLSDILFSDGMETLPEDVRSDVAQYLPQAIRYESAPTYRCMVAPEEGVLGLNKDVLDVFMRHATRVIFFPAIPYFLTSEHSCQKLLDYMHLTNQVITYATDALDARHKVTVRTDERFVEKMLKDTADARDQRLPARTLDHLKRQYMMELLHHGTDIVSVYPQGVQDDNAAIAEHLMGFVKDHERVIVSVDASRLLTDAHGEPLHIAMHRLLYNQDTADIVDFSSK